MSEVCCNRPQYSNLDQVYSDALEAIAQGVERQYTLGWLIENYHLPEPVLHGEMNQALRDALKQGVEREDIDPSWF